MKAQTKNRTTLIESFIGLKDAFKDAMTMFTNNEETNITSVDEIPDIETYTSEDDIKLIKQMDSMREKIRMASRKLDKQIQEPSSRPKNIKAKVVQKELEK